MIRRSICQALTLKCIRKFSRNSIKNILAHSSQSSDAESKNIKIEGWLESCRRQSSKLYFAHIRDGLGEQSLQVIFDKRIDKNIKKQLRIGSCVTVKGVLVTSPGHQQSIELVAEDVEVHGRMDDDHPFYSQAKQNYPDGYLRQYPHLRQSTSAFQRISRARSIATLALHQFLQDHDFVNIHTPIITRNDCEGGGETFMVNSAHHHNRGEYFFDAETSLTVSGQLHLEAATCGIARTYTFSPAFRAEKNITKQHMAEFYMLECELAFACDIDNLMNLVESIVKHIAQKLHDAALIQSDNNTLLTSILSAEQYARISHREAIDLLKNSNKEFVVQPTFDDDLHKEHEWALLEIFNNKLLFVTHYPSSTRPFYMQRSLIDGREHVDNFDLIAPRVTEIAGGSMRERNIDALIQRTASLSSRVQDSLQWYISLRRYGYGPMGGFGIGFDRLIQLLLDINKVRDVVPFPRYYAHCFC